MKIYNFLGLVAILFLGLAINPRITLFICGIVGVIFLFSFGIKHYYKSTILGLMLCDVLGLYFCYHTESILMSVLCGGSLMFFMLSIIKRKEEN